MSGPPRQILETTPRVMASPEPNFLGAFLGLWTMTWKSRLTWRQVARLFCLIFAMPALILLTVGSGAEKAYLAFALGFYQFLLLPISCLSTFGPLIRDELQADTIGFLITRPLTRAKLFLLKFLCLTLWMQILFGLSAAMLLGVGLIKQIDGVVSMAPWFLLAQVLAVLVYGALGALFGLITKKYMVMGVVYGFVVEVGVGMIPSNIHSLSMRHHVQNLLGNSDLAKTIMAKSDLVNLSSAGTGWAIVAILFATTLALVGGALMFTYREYHHSDEMQK
ncbi:MAG: ABC-type transport system involved in multi-copper enzyme maturation permease subunit [Candidatus Binatia bacterium]|jgi:ABC-type transport system involved in multi-copper enzyme maturation permease subunit